MTWNDFMAVVYRVSRKKIVRSQLEIAHFTLDILLWANQQKQLFQLGERNVEQISAEYRRVYMTPIQKKFLPSSERDQIEGFEAFNEQGSLFLPQFTPQGLIEAYPLQSMTNEYWYFYKRLLLREYLLDVLTLVTQGQPVILK